MLFPPLPTPAHPRLLQPTKYLGALGMSSIAELEAQQAEKVRQMRAASPRRRPATVARPASASRRPSNAGSLASPSSPTFEGESPLRPEMTLAAAGIRRASTPGPGAGRRNSDIPDALRDLPGAMALAAAEDGVLELAGRRASSASSAAVERRGSALHAGGEHADGGVPEGHEGGGVTGAGSRPNSASDSAGDAAVSAAHAASEEKPSLATEFDGRDSDA